MVILSVPSAMTKFEIFQISLFCHQSNYFTILLIYETQPYVFEIEIKIKKIQVINVVSIRRYNDIILMMIDQMEREISSE